MNTNALFKSLLLGLIVVLFFGCDQKENGDGESFFNDLVGTSLTPIDQSEYQGYFRRYANSSDHLIATDYENEIIINLNDLIKTFNDIIKNQRSFEQYFQDNSDHALFLSMRKGIESSGDNHIVKYFVYFNMGDPNDTSGEFTPVTNVGGEILVFNELLRCPPMCPTGPLLNDARFNFERVIREIPENASDLRGNEE